MMTIFDVFLGHELYIAGWFYVAFFVIFELAGRTNPYISTILTHRRNLALLKTASVYSLASLSITLLLLSQKVFIEHAIQVGDYENILLWEHMFNLSLNLLFSGVFGWAQCKWMHHLKYAYKNHRQLIEMT